MDINFRHILMTGALLTLSFSACSGAQKELPKAPRYYTHPSGQFPITASYALYHPYMTDQQMKWVKEAGFNNITKVLNQEDTDSLIKLASKHGLTVLVANWEMRDTVNTRQWALRYKNNPTVWGFTAYDEPKADKFNYLATLDKRLATYAKDKTRFFNLLPDVGSKDLGAKNYKTYVEDFVELVNPPFLSIDIYPVKTRKDGEIYVEPILYKTMEVIREVSEESGRPFWSYLLSNKHWSYPKPKREYLRFAAFTALAYGAQGFTYYTYLMPDFDKDKKEYSYAPIDWNGKRTDVWYMVRDINQEIRNLEKVFLGARVIDISQTGKTIPEGTKRLESLPSPFKSIDSDGVGLTVSHLQNGEKNYLLIVNRDVLKKQKVRLYRSRPVTRLYGNGKEKLDKGNSFTLDPGGYALFRF